MKKIVDSTFATPWLASLCSETVVPVAGARSFTAPIITPEILGLMTDGPARLRQEKSAFLQVRLGKAAFAYDTTGMVTDHPAIFDGPVGDAQTKSTANGGVQGPPPWRQPVIT
ncbi:hypothetical protein GCM10022226_48810 [Sphaerisporangium flaviroseum]|uniref:Uncharacterized protein n=1 Tax=Sphaerisporangium flaviroseum TaxID=509199 RepID=A0ABP7IND7_9ACTN